VEIDLGNVGFGSKVDLQEGQADSAFVDRITVVRPLFTPDVIARNEQEKGPLLRAGKLRRYLFSARFPVDGTESWLERGQR